MLDLFLEFTGVAPELFEDSLELQITYAQCCFGLITVGFFVIFYLLVTIFRGWK